MLKSKFDFEDKEQKEKFLESKREEIKKHENILNRLRNLVEKMEDK